MFRIGPPTKFCSRAERTNKLVAACYAGVIATFPVGAFAQAPVQFELLAENPANALLEGRSGGRAVPLAATIDGTQPVASSAAPPNLFEQQGDVAWTAYIRKVDSRIYNPRSGTFDQVHLRAYQGKGTDPAVPFIAPTINLQPGDTFRLKLINQLERNDPSCPGNGDSNTPHCFNSTNMHTHGLWISPTGNSDNVLLRIKPKATFTYEYNIPLDHPAGTFWYHPHLHGSTALQVSSGMAGALIVRGNRLPALSRKGDIDTLLRAKSGEPFAERIVLLQQIPYACRAADGSIKTGPDRNWICDEGDVGTIENYDQFGPGSWRRSGRFTTINGRTVPTFAEAIAGRIERWRLIHAGVRDSVKLQFHHAKKVSQEEAIASAAAAGTAAQQVEFLNKVCSAAPIPQFSLAMDGLTRSALREQVFSDLHPGYREDLLVTFPEPGIYCLIDGAAPGNETVSTEDKSRKLIGLVRVEAGPGMASATPLEHVRNALIESAKVHMPREVRDNIVADLRNNNGLSAFEPHPSLMHTEPNGTQTLGFNIDLSKGKPLFQIGSLDTAGNLIDAAAYEPGRVDRKLPLGAIHDWELRSFLGGHPFHIHVNPFQIVEILDADGNDVSNHDPANTSIYAGLKGVWKDTLFSTMQAAGSGRVPYRIRVRTHYRRYIGEFVLHCHILDHEDHGMMQNVVIGLPDGKGGMISNHH